MIDRILSVAPMMGYTDRHCRYLFRLIAKNTTLFSEMITSSALVFGDQEKLLAHAADEPVVLQLGGNKPSELAFASILAEAAGYQEINLNCGCPSDRVQNAGIGACMMEKPDLTAECYRAMVEAVNIPVTIKSRIGVDKNDSYDFFYTFISSLFDAGCRHFYIHARNAILKGLTPRQNREVPPLRYEHVSKIQSDFEGAHFFINGGIKTLKEAQQLLKSYEGVMLGRLAYKNPMLLHDLEQKIFETQPIDILKIISVYREYMEKENSSGTPIRYMARHLQGLFHGIPQAAQYRREINEIMIQKSPKASDLDPVIANLKTNLEKKYAKQAI